MTTFTRREFSGSTDGRGIKIVAAATAGTLVHTAVSGTSDYDEIWVYLVNNAAAKKTFTLEWGGVTDPDDLIQGAIPSKSGLYLVAPGLPLQNGLIVRCFGEDANILTAFGWVNRIAA